MSKNVSICIYKTKMLRDIVISHITLTVQALASVKDNFKIPDY